MRHELAHGTQGPVVFHALLFLAETGTQTVLLDVRAMMNSSGDEPPTSTTMRLRRPD